MSKRIKWIIVLSVILVILSSIMGIYLWKNRDKILKDNRTVVNEDANNEKTTPKKEKNIEEVVQKKASDFGKEIEISINDSQKESFYILKEDDMLYTLIAKNSLGTVSFADPSKCSENNKTECNLESDYINQVLNDKTSSWNLIGSKRLPTYEEIKALGELNKEENLFLTNNSYWLEYVSEEKKSLDMFYVDQSTKSIKTDKVYNTHELVPVISVTKSSVK